jgi:hypothetical protein
MERAQGPSFQEYMHPSFEQVPEMNRFPAAFMGVPDKLDTFFRYLRFLAIRRKDSLSYS